MPIQRADDPDRLQFRSGGGCLCLFGLPFFCVGLFVMLASVGLLGGKGGGPPWIFGIPFGGIFACVGAGFLFGRAGIVLDRRESRATSWWGLLVPMRRRERPLAEFGRVTISREVRRSKNSTYTVYPVRLACGAPGAGTADGYEADAGGGPLDLEEPRTFEKARAMAEEVAKFLSLPVEDRSGDQVHVRQVDELDLSLREQVRARGEELQMPEAPAGLRCTVRPEGDALVIEIPAPGMTLPYLVQAVAGLVFPGIVCGVFLLPMLADDMPLAPRLFFMGFIGVIFVLGPILMISVPALRGAKRWERVTASPRAIVVEWPGLLGLAREEMPADELAELLVGGRGRGADFGQLFGGGSAVIARSDKKSLQFGGHLRRDEADYVRALIAAVVTV